MSRKNLLTDLGGAAAPPAAETAPAAGGAPVAHLGKMLGAIRDRADRAQEIEKALSAGDRVVEIDPAVIDPSPIADRLPAGAEADAGLRESIAQHGQRVPVLLRRNPAAKDRYLTVYGHRRVAATRALGLKARAIVVDIGDEDAFVAQGVENAERKDLSFIERALFARRLSDAGFAAKTVSIALATARPNVVTMVSLSRRLPDDLVAAIGPSPTLGRRRWEALAARLDAAGAGAERRWRKATAAAEFVALDPDRRLAAVLAALAAPTATPAKVRAVYRDEQGAPFCTVERMRAGEARWRIAAGAAASSRPDGAAFADWLADRLQTLHAAWKRGE